jgi:hypothetical protein
MSPEISSINRIRAVETPLPPQRIPLPRIEKESSWVRKGIKRLGLLPLTERLGLYQGSWDIQKAPEAYANAFSAKYFIKSFYTPGQLAYMPPFPLLGKHAGKRFLILGNGPSLRKFDFSKLGDVVTLGTNTASQFYHAQYVLISNVFAFLRAQPYFDFNRSTLMITGSMWNGPARKDLWKGHEDHVVPFEVADGEWSLEDGRIIGFGHNVGQLAVDVALLMGASSILVVGCDGYKNRNLSQMYAGAYDNRYRKEMATPARLNKYEKMLWERDEETHRLFEKKQRYCEERGIRFGVWGEDCRYERLRRVQDAELSAWC